MVKRGISGGLISIESMLDKSERTALQHNSMIKTSSAVREAAKIGLQSLYANVEDVLEKYKDFDIIKEMKARKGANLLWVRARAIDADVCNTNGDYFSEEELTKEVDYQGKKMPAYKTFEGVPIYTNHKNDNIEEAKGMVVYAEWDDEEKCVYCVFFIDEDAYPDIARGIRHAYIHDVSMGCFDGNTKIPTSNGFKKIIDVDENDKLFDKSGNLVNIVNRQEYDHFEKIHLVTLEGGHQIKCTDYHPFLSFTQEQWKNRKSLKRPKDTNGKKLSKWVQNDISPEYTRLENLKPGDIFLSPIGGAITNDVDFNINRAKLVGYFLAEGSYDSGSHKNRIHFTFNFSEKDSYAQETVDLIREEFNAEAKIYVPKEKNYCRVSVSNENLKNWFFNNCGRWSSKKKLNPKWLQAPYDIQKTIIGSWIDGDGTSTIDKRNNNTYLRVSTISIDLFDQMSFMLSRLGIYHSCYFSYKGKKFDYINLESFEDFHPQCIIQIPSYATCELKGFLHKHVCASSLNKNKHTYNNFLARKIISIQEIPVKQQKVYTFQTESGNYLAHNFISKNCSVDEGVCSICGNKATTERDYCDCLKKYKGKMHPSGKRAFEYNYGIKFIELSCVGDGAFESCEILEIYDQEELLEKAKDTIKTAQSLNSSIVLAASLHEDISHKREVESALRQLQNLNNQIIKIAQTAGTLVGGQLISGGSTQNATVVKILQSLGIDPSGQLNVLDLVNLALNFLEVAVMNLFTKKDNIDLSHVAKLTKAMGELQNTLQDMIDDGIETGGVKSQQPMIPPQAPQQPAQQTSPQSAAPGIEAKPTFFENNVGTMISPFEQQPYVMPLGGGVTAKNSNLRFVWASKNKNEEILFEEIKLNKIGKLAKALENLREACGVTIKNSEGNKESYQKNKLQAPSGDKNIMDNFKKIAQDYKKQNTVALGIDINLDDTQGNRIVLSTDRGIKGFYKGSLTNWAPNLTDTQLSQMENGDGYRVAADLLKDFSSVVKTAEKDATIDHLLVLDENIEQEREYKHSRPATDLTALHTGTDSNTLNEKLNSARTNKVHNTVLDELIAPKRTEELVRIVTKLSEDARKGLGKETLEEMLHPDMSKSSVSGFVIMSNILNGLAKTAKAHNVSGKTVIAEILSLSENNNFPSLMKLARLGKDAREYDSIMSKFAQAMPPSDDLGTDMGAAPADDLSTDALTNVADTATPETSEQDIMDAFDVIRTSFETAVDKLDSILGKKDEEDKKGDMQDALTDNSDLDADTDADSMKGAVTGLSLAGEDTGATPSQLVSTVNSMPTDSMAKQVQLARYPATLAGANKNEKTASKNDLSTSITNWLANVAKENNLSTERVVLAAKLFCSYEDAAVNVLGKSIRTSDVKVTDETSHVTTIYATLDDLGFDVKDAAFNQKFRDYAVDLLSGSGYDVDPHTFALTEISVDENGMVCGKVSTRATKTYIPENIESEHAPYVDSDREKIEAEPAMPMQPELESHIKVSPETIMTASAKNLNRLARLQNVIKVAQGLGLPGAPAGAGAAPAPGAAGGAPADPTLGADAGMDAGMAGGMGDLGVSSLTGSTTPDTSIDSQPEPGSKSPWGTICPQCGSKDVDIANGEGTCNSCNAQLKYKFIVEVAPPEEKGAASTETPETMAASAPIPPTGGIGAPGAMPLTGEAAPTGGAAPGAATGMPPVAAKSNVMVKVAYKTSAEVYANALREGFDKTETERLPVGMICPSCGSRHASKKQRHTYCYDCGTLSVSEIKKVDGEPGILEASIVWI